VGHKGRLVVSAKDLACDLMGYSERVGGCYADKEATKILIEIIDLSKPNRKRVQEAGEPRGFADDFSPRSDNTP